MTVTPSLLRQPSKIPGVHRVYLAGHPTAPGQSSSVAYLAAADALRTVGYDLYEGEHSVAEHARFLVTDAEAIALLPDWEDLAVAHTQVALAVSMGLPVLDALTGNEIDVEVSTRVTPVEERALAASMARHPAGKATIASTAPRPTLVAVPTPGSDEVRMTSVTGGQKGQKEARYSLIPAGPLRELAVLFGRGNIKYPTEPMGTPNWKLGYDWSLSKDALDRHLELFWACEDHDPEMAVKHVICVAWHALVLAWFMENRPEFDDRPRGETYTGALPTPQWMLDLVAERATAALQMTGAERGDA